MHFSLTCLYYITARHKCQENVQVIFAKFLIAALAAQTFGIELDDNIERVIEDAKGEMLRSFERAGAIVISNDSGEYNFEIE